MRKSDYHFHDPKGEHYDELCDVDASPNAPAWLDMLRNMWADQPEKEARYADLFRRLRITPGERILEVGSGAGGVARLLARLTHGQNSIVAVDPSRLAIAEARRLTAEADLAEAIDFRVMDGRALDLPDAVFDVALCTRTLVHAREPETILSEMVRVLRPGGRLLALEPDRDGLLSSAPRDEVNRLLWSRRRSLNPQIGRHLYGLLRRAGLADVEVVPTYRMSTAPPSPAAALEVRQALELRSGDYWELVEAGLVDAAALEEYAEGLEEAARTGIFFRFDLEFCAVGTKPATSASAAVSPETVNPARSDAGS